MRFLLLILLASLPVSLSADMWVSTPPRGLDQLNPLPRPDPKHRTKPPEPEWRMPDEVFRSWTEPESDKGNKGAGDIFTVLETVRPKYKTGFNYLLVQDFYGHQAGFNALGRGPNAIRSQLERDTLAALLYAYEHDGRMVRSIALTRLTHALFLYEDKGLRTLALLLETKCDLSKTFLNGVAEALKLGSDLSRSAIRKKVVNLVLGEYPRRLKDIAAMDDPDKLLELILDDSAPVPYRLHAVERLVTVSTASARQWAKQGLSDNSALMRIQAVRVFRSLRLAAPVAKVEADLEPCTPDLVRLAVDLDDDEFTGILRKRLFENRRLAKDLQTYKDILSCLLGQSSPSDRLESIVENRLDLCQGRWAYRINTYRNFLLHDRKTFTKDQQNSLNLVNRAITLWKDRHNLEGNDNVAGPVSLALIVAALARSSREGTRTGAFGILFPRPVEASGTMDRITFESVFSYKFPNPDALKVYESVPIELNELQAIFLESLNTPPTTREVAEGKRIISTPLDPRVRKAIRYLSEYKAAKKKPGFK